MFRNIARCKSTVLESLDFDTIIRIDRSVSPIYPQCAWGILHPELDEVGPAEYDLSKVELWFYDGQKGEKVLRGHLVYRCLKETDALKTCLGFQDLREIQKKGGAAFRKLFGDKSVYGLKSVAQTRVYRDLIVPYAYDRGDVVLIDWLMLDAYQVEEDRPFARFAN